MSRELSEEVDRAVRGRGSIRVRSGELEAELDVAEAGPVGVSIERLRVSGPEGDPVKRARAVAEHVRPAGERVVPVEVAPELGGARLRTPREEVRGGRYIDIEVDRRSVEVRRMRVGEDGTPRREALPLTREQLREVVDGLERAFEEPHEQA